MAGCHGSRASSAKVARDHGNQARVRFPLLHPRLHLRQRLVIEFLPSRVLAQEHMGRCLVRVLTAGARGGYCTFRAYVPEVVDLAAAGDVLGIEDAEHLRPRCHRPVQRVKVDEVEVCWFDAGLPPSLREEELFGLGALLPVTGGRKSSLG